MTYILMSIFLLIYGLVGLCGLRYDVDKESFFGRADTAVLKGLFCVTVMLVHIPPEYQNFIQHTIGRFAFCGVTFFFMVSAYGVRYGVEKGKEDYLRRFWQKRLPVLLIPMLLCNAEKLLLNAISGAEIHFWQLFAIQDWVQVLLLYYLVFWITYYLGRKWNWSSTVCDAIICTAIILKSLILTFVFHFYQWPTESYGFAYGILLFRHEAAIRDWMQRNWKGKCVVWLLCSIVSGIGYLSLKHIPFLGDYVLKIVLGFCVNALILTLNRRITLGNAALRRLGAISYPVYLLHMTVYAFLSRYPITNSGVFICLAFIITIALACVVERCSLPMLRKMR